MEMSRFGQHSGYQDEGLEEEGLVNPRSMANRDSLRLQTSKRGPSSFYIPPSSSEKSYRCLFLRFTPAWFWVFFVLCLGSIAAGATLLLKKEQTQDSTSTPVVRDNIFSQDVADPTLIRNDANPTITEEPVVAPVVAPEDPDETGSLPPIDGNGAPPTAPPSAVNLPPTPLPTVTPTLANSQTATPTMTPTNRPTDSDPVDPGLTRLEAIRALVIVDSTLSDLFDESSDQYAALEWLADKDPQQILPSAQNVSRIRRRYLAVLLYFALEGKGWRKQYNFLSGEDICAWNDAGEGEAFEGLNCEDDEVVEIFLDGNRARGTIPTEISLFNLRSLGIGTNSIGGTLPTEIGNLSYLRSFNIGSNRIDGTLPSEIGNLFYLQSLILFDNPLKGDVPSTVESLINLETIYMEGTSLQGDIDGVFCAQGGDYEAFYADCGRGDDIQCSCCTHCCDSQGAGCEKTTR